MPAVAKTTEKKAKPFKKGPLVLSNKKKIDKIKNQPKQTQKGIMYIKHLPHGFYENQLRDFFKQFGVVTRVSVARSKKSLRSKGFAFVEFEYREVAQIAAQTMNNYIMFGRIIKTSLLPSGAKRIPVTSEKLFDKDGNETNRYRIKRDNMIKRLNGVVTGKHIVMRNLRCLSKLQKKKEMYEKLGIKYNLDAVTPKFSKEDTKFSEEDEKERLEKLEKKEKAREKFNNRLADAKEDDGEDDGEDDETEEETKEEDISIKSIDWDVNAPSDAEEPEEEETTKSTRKVSALVKAQAAKSKIHVEKEKQKPIREKMMSKTQENTTGKAQASLDAALPLKKQKKTKKTTVAVAPETKTKKNKADKKPQASILRIKEVDSDVEDAEEEPAVPKTKLNKKKLAGGIQKKGKKSDDKKKTQQKTITTGALKMATKSLLQNENVKIVKGKDLKKKKTQKKMAKS